MYPESVEYLNRQRIIPKLRLWTSGATVDLGFVACNWSVSDFYVYLCIVFSASYHCWICSLVSLFSSFIFYYFIYFNKFLKIHYYYYFFLSFLLSFLLSHVADRVLVFRPGVRPQPLRWKSRVQDTRPPETSWLHMISISDSSPIYLRLNTKTKLHPTASRLQCWTSHASQLERQEHTSPISREAA